MAMPTTEEILEALKEIYDPEIPVNIVDLGLIYGVEVDEENKKVKITMTLTAPGCPLANYLVDLVCARVGRFDDVEDVEVELTYEPPWSMDRISEEGKKILRMYGYDI